MSYRDRGGTFHLDVSLAGKTSGTDPALMRFVGRHGIALPLDPDRRPDEIAVLRDARLEWRVVRRPVLIPDERGSGSVREVRGYRALLRPDTGEVMSVVTHVYQDADNRLVAEAAVGLARRADGGAGLVGAAGFGRTNERTLFVVRVRASAHDALLLLAYNSHGGEGAVRFRLVEVHRPDGTLLAPDALHATWTVAHSGKIDERQLRRHDHVQQYLAETEPEPEWHRLRDALWSPRHTKAFISELWGDRAEADGRHRRTDPRAGRAGPKHPKGHLTQLLSEVDDAASAYRVVCRYLDHESEARERGDLTQDRDERLALGTGMRLKERAWQWMGRNL